MASINYPAGLNYYAERDNAPVLNPHDDNLRTNFDEGPARVRQRFTRSSSYLTQSVLLSSIDFEIFKSFYRYTLRQGTQWFNMFVFLSTDYVETEVKFKDKYSATVVNTFDWLVTMTLEVRNLPTLLPSGVYDYQWLYDHITDPIQTAVNVTFPNITASYP